MPWSVILDSQYKTQSQTCVCDRYTCKHEYSIVPSLSSLFQRTVQKRKVTTNGAEAEIRTPISHITENRFELVSTPLKTIIVREPITEVTTKQHEKSMSHYGDESGGSLRGATSWRKSTMSGGRDMRFGLVIGSSPRVSKTRTSVHSSDT
jgi:hypothetical protein